MHQPQQKQRLLQVPHEDFGEDDDDDEGAGCLVRGHLQRILRSGSSHLNLSMHKKTQEIILNKLKQGKR
jgi:hypothetical protein